MKLSPSGKLILIVTGIILLLGTAFTFKSLFKSNTSKENKELLPPQVSPTPSSDTPSSWLTYTDTEYGISFSYPPDWQLNPDSQNFENGDIISLWIWGETQTEGTELFDGASLSVAKPIDTGLSLEEWLNMEFLASLQDIQSDIYNPPPQITPDVTLGSHTAVEVYQCGGLGCFTYRFAKIGNFIYGIVYLVEGPDKSIYLSQIDQILSSFNLSLPQSSGKISFGKCKISGCNREICQDASEKSKMSVCVYKPEFECYKTAICTVQSDGNCGWTQTAELLTCLRNQGSVTF